MMEGILVMGALGIALIGAAFYIRLINGLRKLAVRQTLLEERLRDTDRRLLKTHAKMGDLFHANGAAVNLRELPAFLRRQAD